MTTCPNCGYCPHCGRSSQPYQTYPYQPVPYITWTYPQTTGGTVTIGAGGGGSTIGSPNSGGIYLTTGPNGS